VGADVSHEPFILPQTNQTLHSAAVYRGTIDASAWGATIQRLVTPAPHLGRFCPTSAWVHGDVVGYRSTSGYPLCSLGWTFTSASQYVDIVAASTRPPDEVNRFVEWTVIGSVATPSQPVPADYPIVCRVGTKAGSTTNSAAFTQPAIGSTVLVSLSPTAAWPIVGGTVYVGVIGSAYDVYTVTALTGASPYASITLRLEQSNVVAPGGTVPSGRTVGAAATHSVFVHGLHRRTRWP
jgi:hypothetical protein